MGYLWVYPEDLGTFKQQPLDVIENLNAQSPHGRDNWRIPTPGELAVLEANAEEVGLGSGIYLTTDHSYGVLRMVSTGVSNTEVQRQRQEQEQGEQNRRQAILSADRIRINGIIWATKNAGAYSPQDFGGYYTWDEAQRACPSGWRLPTIAELESLFNSESEWTTLNSKAGREFGNDNGFIFLPAAGSGGNRDKGTHGYYWSSTGHESGTAAYNAIFDSNDTRRGYWYSTVSCSVRCVVAKCSNTNRLINLRHKMIVLIELTAFA